METGIGSPSQPSTSYLKSAFLAMEPAHCIVSLARQCGGGCITTDIQTFMLEHCVKDAMLASEGIEQRTTYIKNILKGFITAAESTCDDIIDGLYEQFAYYMTLQSDDSLLKGRNKIYKYITFHMPDDQGNITSSSLTQVVLLRCSLNMLEGDTGCALWPSSLFLSEFVLSNPGIFSNRNCFEVGSGVGLVGISLAFVGASKVVLTDGDTSSLANMVYNLRLNQLTTGSKVECKHMQWEAASVSEFQTYQPDIVLGADVIYNPQCVPHLVRVLSILLDPRRSTSNVPKASEVNNNRFDNQREGENDDYNAQSGLKEAPIAYVATVIRNYETFNYFLRLANDAHLSVCDITARKQTLSLLPYMLSYDRSNVHLYRISYHAIQK